MTIVTIALGLVGLGIVVFFHELGHFAMARLVGVDVEEFSLGWGPRLVSRKFGATKYTISAFPIGGYCRMSGEDSYKRAIEEGLEDFPREKGTYFGASPIKRILIAFGGPLMNVIFALVVYTVIMASGYEVQSWDNRVILASQYDGGAYPADAAGIETGDRIVSIDGSSIRTFSEIQESISLSAKRPIELGIDRSGRLLGITIRPELDKDSGAGRVGIYPWIEPVADSVDPDGAAALAGIMPGDRIVSVAGVRVENTMGLISALERDRPPRAVVRYQRDGVESEATLVLSYPGGDMADLGIGWKYISRSVKATGFADSISLGLAETGKTISATYRGIASLFMGVNLLKAVSGPARITWMIGTVAKNGFANPSRGGLSVALNFLAVLSIGLFAMNLLPIPLLDGGSITLFIVELIRRKAAKVKTVLRYQTIGMVAVAALFLLSTVGDFLFFSKK
ncbi:MAG: RIP metalloprotease RseP [Spirochaetes bacterium]|nr:RIP metalloprotease RseP [Spirochaetota bacterium]MBU1081357.1 RIP metalloprotease RseP [Spirochaetota bacterium]